MAFSIAHLRLHLVPEAELRLPAHNKGNSLRGGFGNAFRKLVCVDLRWECAECSLRFQCPYTKVFNPFIPPDAPQFTGNQNIPRPFVFKPPLSEQTRYAPDEPLVFELVLIGQAIDYLPYFVVAFRELGVIGFGLNRARVRLERVEALLPVGGREPVSGSRYPIAGSQMPRTVSTGDLSPATPYAYATVYEAATNVVRPPAPMEMLVSGSRYSVAGTPYEVPGGPYPVSGRRGPAVDRQVDETDTSDPVPHTDYRLPDTDDRLPAPEYVQLEFLTPTTLKVGSTAERAGAIVHRPEFHHILKRLRDRINALSTFYGDGPLSLDFKELGEAAEQIETVDDQTRWMERSRVARREFAHDLSGFVGAIAFRGPLAPFLPLLQVGEYVHVGKNTVFGNGWYRISSR